MKHKNKKISVIVLNFNGLKFLKPCFDSLYETDYPKEDLDLIFVDNASSDNSVEFMQKNFPKVKIIENKKNLGFSAGNNVALKNINTEFFVLLNNDTKVKKNWFSELIKAAERDPNEEIGVFCSKMLRMDTPNIIDSAGADMYPSGNGYGTGADQEDKGQFETEREVVYSSGGTLFARTKILEKTGLLDESFFMYYEDLEFCLRVWEVGYKIRYIPKAIVYHKFSGTSGTNPKLKIYFPEKNKVKLIFQHFPISKIILFSPLIFASNMFSYFKLLKIKKFKLLGSLMINQVKFAVMGLNERKKTKKLWLKLIKPISIKVIVSSFKKLIKY